jgi:hypothetical protein
MLDTDGTYFILFLLFWHQNSLHHKAQLKHGPSSKTINVPPLKHKHYGCSIHLVFEAWWVFIYTIYVFILDTLEKIYSILSTSGRNCSGWLCFCFLQWIFFSFASKNKNKNIFLGEE